MSALDSIILPRSIWPPTLSPKAALFNNYVLRVQCVLITRSLLAIMGSCYLAQVEEQAPKPVGWTMCFLLMPLMLVTFGICLKQYFDTRYLVFYNTSPPRMFLSLDFLWEYRIQHGANGPLYVTPSYSTWIFGRGVSGFATDCPCGVWCRGLTTCLLHVGPPFGNRILNNSWAVGLT